MRWFLAIADPYPVLVVLGKRIPAIAGTTVSGLDVTRISGRKRSR